MAASIFNSFTTIVKRDGSRVPFSIERIGRAVARAMQACGEGDPARDPFRVAQGVVEKLNQRFPPAHTPTVEEIQDLVEEALVLFDLPKTAKAYILYRQQRSTIRDEARTVPEQVRRLAAESKRCFPNALAEFIYYRTYSRWIEQEGRRETWIETVDRYMRYMRDVVGERLRPAEYAEIRDAILSQRVMPSMRLLWSAGQAAAANNIAAYNCAFIAPRCLRDFAEIMYVLMCGTGVGFSVESRNVQQLPIVKPQSGRKLPVHVIGDSKEGWCDALRLGLETWYGGGDVEFDFSQLRPAGARLRTMSGRSSGPEPLRMLLGFGRAMILERQERRLRGIDVHDLICKIGEVVVMGGVRRSALISLSDLDDDEMRAAKDGHFYISHPERSNANNSAVYNAKPPATVFLEEWLALARSGSGERGIFNRSGLVDHAPARRKELVKRERATCGTNPCGEIILRSKQFCNLSEVVARADDTEETLLDKIRIATIIGTYQSTLTSFPYLSADWRNHCEEERLLGVSITGQWDCPVSRDPGTLQRLKACAIATNRRYAERFGVGASTAVTCVKPSGTVSLLVDSASGMHPRFAEYYIRRIRISVSDPLFAMLREQKFPCHPEVGQIEGQATTYVLEFPVKAPPGAITRNALCALAQLEYWKTVKLNYTEHNPSITVSVGEDEWIATANWLFDNWEIIGGLSFLPRSDSVYQLSPYEEVSRERYEELLARMPQVDFSRIIVYEKEDWTITERAPACSSAGCDYDPEEAPLGTRDAEPRKS
jgi:ribonucleoside-diphosphate reductase alpha chain